MVFSIYYKVILEQNIKKKEEKELIIKLKQGEEKVKNFEKNYREIIYMCVKGR